MKREITIERCVRFLAIIFFAVAFFSARAFSQPAQSRMPESRMKNPSEYVEMMLDEKLSREIHSAVAFDLAKSCFAVTWTILKDLEEQGISENRDLEIMILHSGLRTATVKFSDNGVSQIMAKTGATKEVALQKFYDSIADEVEIRFDQIEKCGKTICEVNSSAFNACMSVADRF